LAGTVEVVAGSSLELLRERERRQTPEYRDQQRAAQQAQDRAHYEATRAPVTFAALHGHQRELSLRAAAVDLAERYAGEIRVEDGHAVIVAPPFPARAWEVSSDLREIVQTLVAAERVIVEAAKGKDGLVDASKLPDRPVSPTGALL
jgi:hypothetical protein